MTLLDQLPADEVHTNDRLKDVLAALDRVHEPEMADSYVLCDVHRRDGFDVSDYSSCLDCVGGKVALCRCGAEEWPCRTVREVAEALEFDVDAIGRDRETT